MNSWINIKYKMGRYLSTARSFYNDMKQVVKLNKSEYKKYEKRIFINRLYFEVTNICNAKCIFCAYPLIKHKTGVMKFKTFKKAIDEWAKLGGKVVSFTPTVGDPLLDPGLLDKIKYAAKLKGIEKIYFYTNGILLNTNNLYRKLVDSGIHEIHISITEFSKHIYEKVHGVKLYEEVVEGVYNLLSYNNSQGNRVKIYFDFRPARNPKDVLNSTDFIRYVKPFLGENVTYTFMFDYDNWGGVIKKKNLIGIMKLRRIPRKKVLPCIRTFDAAILFDGSVRLCACRVKNTEFDELVVGNIHNNSLKDIFYGEKSKKVRERFVMRNPPDVCKDCSFYVPADTRWLKLRLRQQLVL